MKRPGLRVHAREGYVAPVQRQGHRQAARTSPRRRVRARQSRPDAAASRFAPSRRRSREAARRRRLPWPWKWIRRRSGLIESAERRFAWPGRRAARGDRRPREARCRKSAQVGTITIPARTPRRRRARRSARADKDGSKPGRYQLRDCRRHRTARRQRHLRSRCSGLQQEGPGDERSRASWPQTSPKACSCLPAIRSRRWHSAARRRSGLREQTTSCPSTPRSMSTTGGKPHDIEVTAVLRSEAGAGDPGGISDGLVGRT